MREFVLSILLNNMINRVREENNTQRKYNILTSVDNNENEDINNACECSICWDEKEMSRFVKLGCKHEFCKDCIINSLKLDQRNTPCCALCRGEITSIKSRTTEVHNELSELVA
jgi:hypothetical protein